MELVNIGKVNGLHGVKGNLKVYSYAESFSSFNFYDEVIVKNSKGESATYKVNWAKQYRKGILLSFKGINSIDLAETLVGSDLYIKKDELPDLEEGVYYWSDIIGLEVFDINDKYIGKVENIISTGSNDVYVVKDKKTEILIPGLESIVLSIDIENKKMLVDLPEGL